MKNTKKLTKNKLIQEFLKEPEFDFSEQDERINFTPLLQEIPKNEFFRLQEKIKKFLENIGNDNELEFDEFNFDQSTTCENSSILFENSTFIFELEDKEKIDDEKEKKIQTNYKKKRKQNKSKKNKNMMIKKCSKKIKKNNKIDRKWKVKIKKC